MADNLLKKLLCRTAVLVAAVQLVSGGAVQANGTGLQSPAAPYVRIDVRYPGVYRVTGAELGGAGVDLSSIDPGNLMLLTSGTLQPLAVQSAAKGAFGAGDFIEFVGDSPRGDSTWFLPENKHNVYFLSWSPENAGIAGRQMAYREAAPVTGDEPVQSFWQWKHVEKDYQFWFSTLPPDKTDNFYWLPFFASLSPGDVNFTAADFSGFDKTVGLPATLGMHLFGATNADNLKPAHQFRVLVDGKPVGQFEFDGIALHDASFALPPETVTTEPMRIAFDAPPERKQAVDKIYLDWLTLQYPSRFEANGAELYTFNNNLTTATASTQSLALRSLPGGATVFDTGSGAAWTLKAEQKTALIPNSSSLTTYTAVAPGARMHADHVELVTSQGTPESLPQDLQALVIYYPTLQATAENYVRYRQERGWKIAAVSVRSVFDQLNNGYIHDGSLRQYIGQVHERAPRLTHVVLIGDAYFDFREARSYDEQRQLEVLVPIHWVYRPGVTWSGGYQDDNWYGSFTNEFRPDIAVGRIPVNSDAEGMEYLRKVIEYETFRKSLNDPGLLISSVEQSFQEYVNEIGTTYKDRLSSFTYLFPKATEAPQEVASLQTEINKGKQLLYYVGHGGSLVWRVGPVDFARQKDLFTPADVHQLKNRGHYPLVVCASCYTTAFDQPESIGEALANQPAGGAIAVIGAPWKATVQESHEFNRLLFKYYFDAGVRTLGEASLKAHQEHIPPDQKQALYNSFTLLGDPCLEIVR